MQTVGSQVVVKIVKNKHAPPFRNAEFELEFGKGISREAELIDLGCKHKFITKASAWFYMNNQSFQGRDALKRFLSENVSVRDELENKLRHKLMNVEADDEKGPTEGTIDEKVVDEVSVVSDTTDEEVVAAAEA